MDTVTETDIGNNVILVLESRQLGATVLRMSDHNRNRIPIPDGYTLVNLAFDPPSTQHPQDNEFVLVHIDSWSKESNLYELRFNGELVHILKPQWAVTYLNGGPMRLVK
jgi:hypothetical protein